MTCLEEDLWQGVLAHLKTWPRESPRECAHYHRIQFLARFLQLTGLRRFDIAKASTADIRRKDGVFWLHVEGKRNVVEDIPLTSSAMQILSEYRRSTGPLALPDPTMPEPLLMDIAGAGRPVSVKSVHAILKDLFRSAFDAYTDSYQAEKLKAASAHWLRHTATSYALTQGIGLLHTRDLLRHASVQTTEIHLHLDQKQLAVDLEKIQQQRT